MDPRGQRGYIRARASLRPPALTTYVNVLSVILVSYHFILLLLSLDDDSSVYEKIERHKVGRECERVRENVGRERREDHERKEDARGGEKRAQHSRARSRPATLAP